MKPKILLVNDYYSHGGAENIFLQTAQHLQDQDFQVNLFYGAKTYERPSTPMEYITSSTFLKKIKKKIIAYDPDIIHVHNYKYLLTPSILKAVKICRDNGQFDGAVIHTAHDYHLLCPHSAYFHYEGDKIVNHDDLPTFWDFMTKRYDHRGFLFSTLKKIQWWYNYSLHSNDNQIDAFLFPSEFLKSKYEKRYTGENLHLVRYPYEFEFPDNSNDEAEAEENIVQLVFLGRISPEKGVKEFIQSLSRSNFNKYELDIIGDGPALDEVSSITKELGLQPKINILGRIPKEEVIQKISHYDALVAPSLWYENAPLVLLEAVIANIRMVTNNWGGMKELAELYGESYLMNSLDAKSVEKTLDELYSDIFLKKTKVNREIKKIKRINSKELYIDKLIKIYDKYI